MLFYCWLSFYCTWWLFFQLFSSWQFLGNWTLPKKPKKPKPKKTPNQSPSSPPKIIWKLLRKCLSDFLLMYFQVIAGTEVEISMHHRKDYSLTVYSSTHHSDFFLFNVKSSVADNLSGYLCLMFFFQMKRYFGVSEIYQHLNRRRSF